jgi:GMP synthase (glutamine-hydrolysing)
MIVHQGTSSTGRIGRLLRARGYEEDIRCPNIACSLPTNFDDYAGVVVFGGPMSANDDATEHGIRAELDWIPKVLQFETPYLGVCLGAQLLARALGAKVWEHPQGAVEIGYHEVHPTAAGAAYFDAPQHMYQWHRDSFDLPHGAELLATGEIFANEAFRYGTNAFALQFHPEVTRDIMLRWLTGGTRRLVARGAQMPEAQRHCNLLYDAAVERWLIGFLDSWLPAAGNDTSRVI